MGELRPGERLLLASGQEATVKAARCVAAARDGLGRALQTPVYNFQVKGWHSYFAASYEGATLGEFAWVHNASGSYTIEFNNKKKYHGKGGIERAKASAARLEKKHGIKQTSLEWVSEKTEREGFKAEYERLRADQGPGRGKARNYNERQSPGKKYTEEDQ